jgi:hypothetical protein
VVFDARSSAHRRQRPLGLAFISPSLKIRVALILEPMKLLSQRVRNEVKIWRKVT